MVLCDYPVRPPLFTLAVSNNGSYIRDDYIRVCILYAIFPKFSVISRWCICPSYVRLGFHPCNVKPGTHMSPTSATTIVGDCS